MAEPDWAGLNALIAQNLAVQQQAGSGRYPTGGPVWVAHRAGGSAFGTQIVGPYPENTLEGARALVEIAASRSIPGFVLHVQCSELADGGIGLMHDQTVDRTTTGTGNVTDFSTAAFAQLTVDAGTWQAPGWGNLRAPLLDDFLREFGGRVPILIGAYSWGNGAVIGAKVAAKIVARGLQSRVAVASFSAATLVAVKNAGIATVYNPPNDPQAGSDAATIAALDIWALGQPKRVDVDYTASSDAYIRSLQAAGLDVGVYFTSKRTELPRLAALGITRVVSDEVIYQSSTAAVTTTAADPTSRGLWPHGLLLPVLGRGRGQIAAGSGGTGYGLRLDRIDWSGQAFSCFGAYCPITATTYTLGADVFWETVPSGDMTRHADIAFAAPDDSVTSGVVGTDVGVVDGYTVILRGNGQVGLYRTSKAAQTSNQVGSTQSTGVTFAAGQTGRIVINVTPTTINLSVVVGGTTYGPYPFTDSTYRGGYFHLGKAQGSGTSAFVPIFKNVTVA